MSDSIFQFITLDLFPLLAATLASLVCALLGNYLVLRRQSMMGDAISHAVLPGLVVAFLITQQRLPIPMFLGAAVAGLITVILIELVRKLGRVEPGAAMGVVFSVLFAFGVLLLSSDRMRSVDLDADCVLHGVLEGLTLNLPHDTPHTWGGIFSLSNLAHIPRPVATLLVVLLISSTCVALLFKEFRFAAFDPALATAQGFRAGALHMLLMALVAAATVASFEAVGSILVIAMLICPPAAARLLTDRLNTQIWISLLLALATAVLGYSSAIFIPSAIGRDSVSVAGSIAVASGLILALAALFAPTHGVLARTLRQKRLTREIALDDLLAMLYRAKEIEAEPLSVASLGFAAEPRTLAIARQADLIALANDRVTLTPSGLDRARNLVRTHRLWETYLVDEAGLAPDHVHDIAEKLEHTNLTPPDAEHDPHGRRIPSE
ncbi:MAG: metal ABC transporter permease [Phycisphaerales bacterium]